MCGIGSYTKYLATYMPNAKIISFDLKTYRLYGHKKETNTVYTINPDKIEESAKKISKIADGVLWFQHSFGMWQTEKFIQLLKMLKKQKKIASFHTIHFQSKETKYGLDKGEYLLLKNTLPYLDVATFFTDGARSAVMAAFPNHSHKLILLRHGTHLYPKITRKEAKHKLFEYLTTKANISERDKKGLKNLSSIFFKKKTKIIGNVGFITPGKAEEFVFITGLALQNMLPRNRIIVLRMGTVRDPSNPKAVEALKRLKILADGKRSFLLNCYIPEEIFKIAIKSFNVLLFWPDDCTQSGRLAHAQGTGAAVVGKDMEGLGETLKQSNYFTAKSYDVFLSKVKEVVLSKNIRMGFERSAKAYAAEFHYKVQAKKHLQLAKAVLNGEKLPILDH